MSESTTLTVLHISDFHYTKRRARDQKIVIDALVKDLESICIGHRQPDLVLFTGDLVDRAGLDSHSESYDSIIGRIGAATKCSDERIFIAPGNHDAQRAIVEANLSEHTHWRNSSNDMEAINELFEQGAFVDVAAAKFLPYLELDQYLSDGFIINSNVFVTVYRVSSLNIDIVSINTALFSGAGLPALGSDQGRLAVAEYAIRDALSVLKPESFRIFLTHHPLHWLSETSARFLRSVIQQHGMMHLFGHMHDPLSASITSFEGDLYSDQAAAIFTGRSRPMGYSLICIEPDKRLYETHLRSFFKERTAFDEAIDVVAEGKFYSSQEARLFWRGMAAPVDDSAFRRHLSNNCLVAMANSPDRRGIGDRKLEDLFVPAPMMRNTTQPKNLGDAAAIVDTPVLFNDFVSGDGNCIVYASPEFGRTTFLRQLEFHLLRDAQTLPTARMPTIIDFSEIGQNVNRMLRTLTSRVAMCGEFDFESLLKLGRACVMVDDVVFEDARRMSILRHFVRSYPKARYILTSLKDHTIQLSALVDPEMPVHFDFVELCAFRRRDMRQLVAKWSSGPDTDRLLDRIQQEIGQINLPFTAANGSILMVILEEEGGFHPINRSVLIEQFIDITLKKGAVEQVQRETFDYHNKTALLAHVAGWMARNDTYIVEAEKIRDVMKGYVDKIEVTVNLTALMQEFLSRRLWIPRSDDRISFRYRAVLEYFIALEMRKDGSFREWVTDEERYLNYTTEIQYYAGSVRSDANLSQTIASRFEALLEEVSNPFGGIDLNRLANLKLPIESDDGVSFDYLRKQLSEVPLSEEERDAELETEIPRDAEERQEVFRPRADHYGHRFLLCLLLLSGLVKNMEEISGAEKRRHLKLVWRGWGVLLHLSLQIVPELAKKRRMRINGVLYEIQAPLGLSDDALTRQISLAFPAGVSRLIASSLGTEKLEQQLTEPGLDDANEPLVIEFFKTCLVADLKLSRTVSSLNSCLERLQSSPYLLEAMIYKIAQMRRFQMISEERFLSIRNALAAGMAILAGSSGSELSDAKRKELAKIERQGVLLRIRQQRDVED